MLFGNIHSYQEILPRSEAGRRVILFVAERCRPKIGQFVRVGTIERYLKFGCHLHCLSHELLLRRLLLLDPSGLFG